MGLFLDRHINKTLDAPGATGRPYLRVFDQADNALCISAVPYSMQPYTAANAALFQLLAAVSAQREFHYAWSAAASGLNLGENAYGDFYSAEWAVEKVSGTCAPSVDTFLERNKFMYDGSSQLIESRLGIHQETKIENTTAAAVFSQAKDGAATWEAYFNGLSAADAAAVWAYATGAVVSGMGAEVNSIWGAVKNFPAKPASQRWESLSSVGYYSQSQLLSVSMFTELDGQIQTNMQSLRYLMWDSTGTVKVDATVTAAAMTSLATLKANGFFIFSVPSIALSPDVPYNAVVIATDVNGLQHVSGAAPVAWD